MKKSENQKPVPVPCVCGRPAVLVRTRGGKMYTCPDPMHCKGNLRTRWNKHEPQAATEWNTLVQSFRAAGR